jgi:hypothetical protein
MKQISRIFMYGVVTLILAVPDILAQTAPTASPSEGTPAFSIARLLMCARLENREPVGIADNFPESAGKVFCFIEARDIAADTTLTVVWKHDGKEVNRTDLNLKQGARWRTNAVKTISGMTGDWEVSVLNADGNTVQTITFKVE